MRQMSSGSILITLVGLATLIFSEQIFFQKQFTELYLPIAPEILNIYENHPILKLKVIEPYSSENKSYHFSLDNEPRYFTIDEFTGYLYFNHTADNWYIARKRLNFTARVTDVEGSLAEAQLRISIFQVNEVQRFCHRFACFYQSVHYNTFEFIAERSNEIIDSLMPSIYRRICKGNEIEYFQLNGTSFLTINKNKRMVKKPKLDYEKFAKRRLLQIDFQCDLRDSTTNTSQRKAIDILVFDRDDSEIMLHKNLIGRELNVYRNSSLYQKGERLNITVIFTDDDSPSANRRVEFQLRDDLNIFRTSCETKEMNHSLDYHGTEFVCDFHFKNSGKFNKSPHCFYIVAIDKIVKRTLSASAEICVYEPVKKPIIVPTYPNGLNIYRNATFLARVVQPTNIINETGFHFINNPYGAFNITSSGGIVYVSRPELLARVPASSIKLEIAWKSVYQQINVHLLDADTFCSQNTSTVSCEAFTTRSSCKQSCGIGSRNSHCSWRSLNAKSEFKVCVADKKFCPNRKCDPLEQLGLELGHSICQYDCGAVTTVSLITMESTDIADSSCPCELNKDDLCFCEATTEAPETSSEQRETTNSDSSILNSVPSNQFKCGALCIFLYMTIMISLVVASIIGYTVVHNIKSPTSIEQITQTTN